MLEATQVVAALAALAQSTRLAIYRLLVVSGSEGLPAGQIAERLQLAPATLSFHFKTLSHAGLIESRQEGRYIFYVANYSVMNEMLAYLTENCCAGAGESCEVQVSKC
ncbi:MAG: metalloregulator ArsR/SmtB family transcription factor [Gallionella sp.]|nr:metalloregulator ArsR/SmtB family transcription factor [Gallionella sp.]